MAEVSIDTRLAQEEMRMALEEQVEKLKTDHAGLENQIEEELARPHPDDQILADLKRKKLRIKDELLRLDAD